MIKKVEFLGLYNEPQDLGLKFKNLVAPGVPSLFIMEIYEANQQVCFKLP